MIKRTEKFKRGRTQNKGINDKKDWETEQGEEHKIKWKKRRKTGNHGKKTK